MAKREREENSLKDLLGRFVKKNRLEKGLDQVSVTEAWHRVLGEGVSGYTQQIKLEGQTLFVNLSSSVLREELSYGRARIIKLLNEDLGREVVNKLVLR